MRFQKSIRIAPGIHINLSKSGVGMSVGPCGLKVGVDGKGHRYSSVGIPGTGISQRTYGKAGDDEFAAIWAAQQLARMETTTLTRRLVPKTLSASFMELG